MDTRRKARWATRRAQGLCGECGQVASEKFSRCTLCRQFVNEARKTWLKKGAGKRINRQKRERYWSDPDYREERRERARQFWADNREAGKAANRAYYLAHRDELIAKQRARDARRTQAA